MKTKSKLKKKQNKSEIYIPLKLKKIIHEFENTEIEKQTLTPSQRLILKNFVLVNYGITDKAVFDSADSNQYVSTYQKTVRHFLVKLIANGVPLLMDETAIAQKIWNDLSDTLEKSERKMQSTRVGVLSGTYIQHSAALTWLIFNDLHSRYGNIWVQHISPLYVADFCTKLFTRYKTYCRSAKKLSVMKKVTMGRFLFHLFIDLDNFLIDDEQQFKSSLYVYESKHPEQFEKFKHIFFDAYSKKESAERSFSLFNSSLAQFVDRRIYQIKDQNVDTCDFKLLVRHKRKPPVFVEYIQYLKDLGIFKCTEFINDVNWTNFVNHKMRSEYGYKNFWKDGDTAWK